MIRRPARRLLAALALGATTALVACTTAEPAAPPNPVRTRPVDIFVNAHSQEQIVLGEVYHQTFQKLGRASTLNIVTESEGGTGLAELRGGPANFIIGCTGLFLHTIDPARARTLSEEIAAGEVADPAEETWNEFVGSLHSTLTAPDPSPAQGCAEEVFAVAMPDLPQSIVPVYSRSLFNRAELKEITTVTRYLTTGELQELIEETRQESSVSRVVSEWIGSVP